MGTLPAYVTPDPKDGKRRPAIVWITGGDCNSIGDVWSPAPAANDQTAAAFRNAGVVMMFPSLRGGNANPGQHEAFYGETQDVIAAADFLAKLDYVDPQRIYLGGHSTGGTLALLTAEVTSRFRAVIAFGPVASAEAYGQQSFLPVDFSKLDPRETLLRRPGAWLDSITSRTLILEGAGGNAYDLNLMKDKNRNPKVSFLLLPGANHFNILAPANALLARKVVEDTGPTTTLSITADEIASAVK